MTEYAYTADALSIRIEDKDIVRDVSFSLIAGTSMAIIGPNGAGKSTLLKGLLRLLPHSAGRVNFFGKPLDQYKRRDLARLAAYVPQAGPGLFPYTVEEFVLMARYPYLTPFSHFTSRDREIAANAMAQADVSVFAQRFVHTLSGGERQKVFIAAALTQEPRVILLDEATAFLDYRHQVEVLALVDRLRKDTGLTVVAVTHDLNQGVLQYEQVLALKAGRPVFIGAPEDLLRENRLEAIYDASFHLLNHPETGMVYVVPGGNIL